MYCLRVIFVLECFFFFLAFSKLEKLERKREQESEEDLTSLTTEFTERIGIMEKKLHVANKVG